MKDVKRRGARERESTADKELALHAGDQGFIPHITLWSSEPACNDP